MNVDKENYKDYQYKPEELGVLRLLAQFPEVVTSAAEKYSPNILCAYLFTLAQEFNLFYQKLPILKEQGDVRDFRLFLTKSVGDTIKNGLNLLGIKAPEEM